MKSELLPLLRCVSCHRDSIALDRVFKICKKYESDKIEEIVVEGLLKCKGCGSLYPILEGIPRLVEEVHLNEYERDFLEHPPQVDIQEECSICAAAIETDLEGRIERAKKILEVEKKLAECSDPFEKKRLAEYFDHNLKLGRNKMQYARTVKEFLMNEPQRIVDIGGGQGANLSCFNQCFRPKVSVLVDISIKWIKVAMIMEPSITGIKADAKNLPFKKDAFNLVLTSGLLEHTNPWRYVTAEIVRIAKEGFIMYTPNGSCPYELGHLGVPLITYLPKRISAYLSFLWLKIVGQPRPLNLIKKTLKALFFIPRWKFVKFCETQNVETKNLFSKFMKESVKQVYHYRCQRILKFLRIHPKILEFLTWLMTLTSTEPSVYIYFRKGRKSLNEH